MNERKDGKFRAMDLADAWAEMVSQGALPPEIHYRISKMIQRILPMTDKMFIKTVKAGDIIADCLEKTRRLDALIRSGASPYPLLTDIEQAFEDLLKKTYEFRIKAG